MARITSLLGTAIVVAAFALSASAGTRAQKKAENVNYDDPNMAFTADYAADQAVTCPKTLKGRKLRACLVKNGLATTEDINESAEILNAAPPSSFH